MTQRWFFASCARGLEGLLETELTELGATTTRVDPGGVSFQGTPVIGYAACLWSRVATRVFEELQRGRIQNADDLYKVARRVDWHKFLTVDQTFAVHARVSGPNVRDGRFAGLKVKDAVADHFVDHQGSRPNVDTDDPILPIRVTIKGTVATISRDLAGVSLHKRGYRPASHISPLNEALTAGLLLLSDWDRKSPVIDPMCGSGTFLIEAAFILGDRAPGLKRSFAFERWVDLQTNAWEKLKAAANERWLAAKGDIPVLQGNDIHEGALALTTKAAGRAEVSHLLDLTNEDVEHFVPAESPVFVVSNPPYGERLGEGDELIDSWFWLGKWLKNQAPGATAWILSGNPELSKHLRLKTSRRIPMMNGPIECRWLRYSLREGKS